MDDYEQRKLRWRELLNDAAAIRDEALAFGRNWSGFAPAFYFVVALEQEAKRLSHSFAH